MFWTIFWMLIAGLIVAYIVLSIVGQNTMTTLEYDEGNPCLTFDQFRRFYELCSDKFELWDDFVKVQTRNPRRWYEDKDRFYFKTMKDLRRYKAFKKVKDALDKADRMNKESTEATQRLIIMLQAEIDKHSKEANAEINGALDKQQEILNRMMGG